MTKYFPEKASKIYKIIGFPKCKQIGAWVNDVNQTLYVIVLIGSH